MRKLINIITVYGMILAFTNSTVFDQSNLIIEYVYGESLVRLELKEKMMSHRLEGFDSIGGHPEARYMKEATASTSGIMEYGRGIRIYKRLGKEQTQEVLESTQLEWVVNY